MKKQLLILITFLLISSTCIAKDKAIIVFDASGSMWGQVEGKNKIAIAKKTLINLVNNWGDSSELGLLAYGHRRKGDCSDIQTLVPVGKVNKSEMIARVKNINPKGKTPISASIKMAADELKFTEDSATVILISDGKETCKADPCKTASELEKLGVNFTAHVIGFDVDQETSKQLKCIADNTGGKYFSADNAKELSEALDKVVEQPKSLTIQAMDKKNGGKLRQLIEWKLINQETEEVISLSGNGSGKEITVASKEPAENTLSKGRWTVSGTSGMYSGEASIEITGNENQLIKVDMLEQLPKVTLTALDEATTGTELIISWDAPDVDKAKMTLQEVDEKPNYHSNPSLFTENFNKTKEAPMRLPSTEGNYLLRFYNLKDKNTVLATHKVTLKAAEIEITAPDEAVTGTELELSWIAPKESKARIVLQMADDKPRYHTNPSIYTELYKKKNNQGIIRLPSDPGKYVLRWFNVSDKKSMLEHPIKLVKAQISVDAPAEAVTGTELELSWIAPKQSKARIVLQMADDKPQYHTNPSVYTEKKKQGMMKLPSEAGDYMLRWFNSSDKKLVMERSIKLVEAQITINAADEAGAGTEIDISWEAPKNSDARITLELAEDKPKYHTNPSIYTKGNKKTLRLPSVAGEYVLRWYNTSDKKLITEHPIKITEQTITITAKDEETAGTEIELFWKAPKGLDSFINIQLADEKPSYSAQPYVYTKKQSSGYMRVPSNAGDYMLRWYNKGDRKNVIAERPISLTSPKIEITAPEEAIAGTELEISWKAPKDLDSFINIQLADEKPNYSAKYYVYTKKKTSDYLRLPSKQGDYILRWFNKNDRKSVIVERPISLTSPKIEITAPKETIAGTELEISWSAPKDLDSFINIQPADEKPNYNAKNYIYTKRNSSDYMKMPDAPGNYILRWYNQHDRTMMIEKKIKINSKEE